MHRIAIAVMLLGGVVLAQDATRFADEAAHDLFLRSRAAVVPSHDHPPILTAAADDTTQGANNDTSR